MKLLFDQNLSHRLVALLAAEFPGSEHVRNLGMAAASDPAIWAFAQQAGFAIVSKDVDFEQRALLFGHPPKVIGSAWETAPPQPWKPLSARICKRSSHFKPTPVRRCWLYPR
jgi:predicted nuclease of predicted toxin-antitoxin system